MKTRVLSVALCAAVVAPLALPTTAQAQPGKVLLRLRLAKGQRYVMNMTTNNTIQVPPMGKAKQGTSIRQSMMVGMNGRVLSVAPNGVMTTQMVISQMKMVMNMGGGRTMNIDGARPSSDPTSKMFGAMLNVPLVAQMTPTGKTLSVKGFDVITRRMMNSLPSSAKMTAAQKQQMAASMQKMMDPKRLQGFGQNFYPARAVGVGDRWSVQNQMAGQGMMPGMAMTVNYRLLKRAGGISYISAQGRFSQRVGAGATTSGTQNMTLQVDERTGLARTMSGTMNITSKAGQATSNIKGTLNMTMRVL